MVNKRVQGQLKHLPISYTMLAMRTSLITRRTAQSVLMVRRGMAGTPPKSQEGKDDGNPTSYNIPPKESTSDKPLPKSQNEHPGPIHKEGEEKRSK
jgi:hypothetical protein